MPQPFDINLSQSHMACALFDNVPDSPDELAFQKGDVLVVLEHNVGSIDGWWLCSLGGRQGICPANRLNLLPNLYDVPQKDLTSIDGSITQRNNHKMHSEECDKNNVEFSYYNMPNRSSPLQQNNLISSQPIEGQDYDVPPSRHVGLSVSQGCPRCASASPSCSSPISRYGDAYDVPRPHHHHLNQLTPSSSASSLTADSVSSSNRSSVVNMPEYDVPKPHPKGPHLVLQSSQLYDVPPSHNSKELLLTLNSALETLEKLENHTTSSIKKLLGFVGPNWRTHDKLKHSIVDIRQSVIRLQSSLNELAEFGEGTLGNATKAADKNLAVKLAPLVSSLKKSYSIINNSIEKLNKSNWNAELLSNSEELEDRYVPDALDSLISCSKALTDDVRQITSFIQGNSLLLFKKESEHDWTNEYDYLQLGSKNHDQKEESLIEDDAKISPDNEISLDPDDRHLLTFFGGQFIKYHKNLVLAIEAFLNTVERNQPPKIFLGHGKFVVLSAHKLVLIGDTVHRNISCKEIKERVKNCSNALSDVLVQSVAKTKQAALQFPTVIAVQEMVDSVLDISHSANNLKLCLLQANANFL